MSGTNKHNTPINRFSVISFNIGIQTTGDAEWQQLHNMPSYGLGIAATNINNHSEIGRPISIFGFYHGVIKHWKKSALRYHTELGLAYGWKPYDIQNNPYNIAIGSKLTARISFGLDYEMQIGKHYLCGIGANLTHFSNGAIRKPNKGVNFVAPFVRFSYLFNNNREIKPLIPILIKRQAHEVQLSVGYGRKQEFQSLWRHPELSSAMYEMQSFNMFTLKVGYMRQYCQKGKWGVGISMYFDEWIGSDITIDEEGHVHKDLSQRQNKPIVGYYIGHEFLINRIAIVSDLGYNFYTKHVSADYKNDINVFERLGLKYYLPFNAFIGVNVFANRVKANIVEWNMGYALQWSKRVVDRQ